MRVSAKAPFVLVSFLQKQNGGKSPKLAFNSKPLKVVLFLVSSIMFFHLTLIMSPIIFFIGLEVPSPRNCVIIFVSSLN